MILADAEGGYEIPVERLQVFMELDNVIGVNGFQGRAIEGLRLVIMNKH